MGCRCKFESVREPDRHADRQRDRNTGHLTSIHRTGEHIPSFSRKDVWDMRWADDNPELFAMMERTYMYIFR